MFDADIFDSVKYAAIGGWYGRSFLLVWLIYIWATDMRLADPSQKTHNYFDYFLWPMRLLIAAVSVYSIASHEMLDDFLNLSVNLPKLDVMYRFMGLFYTSICFLLLVFMNFIDLYKTTTILYYEKLRRKVRQITLSAAIVLWVIVFLGTCGVSFGLLNIIWKLSIVIYFCSFITKLLLEQRGVSIDAENSRIHVRNFWKRIDIDLEKADIINKPTKQDGSWKISCDGVEYEFYVENPELLKTIGEFDKYRNTTEVSHKLPRNDEAFDLSFRKGKIDLYMGYFAFIIGTLFIPFIYWIYEMSGEPVVIYLLFPEIIILYIVGIFALLDYYRYSFRATENGIDYRGIFQRGSLSWDEITAEVRELTVVFKKNGRKVTEVSLIMEDSNKLLKILKEIDLCHVEWKSKHEEKIDD